MEPIVGFLLWDVTSFAPAAAEDEEEDDNVKRYDSYVVIEA
jgi:hypothetical protein